MCVFKSKHKRIRPKRSFPLSILAGHNNRPQELFQPKNPQKPRHAERTSHAPNNGDFLKSTGDQGTTIEYIELKKKNQYPTGPLYRHRSNRHSIACGNRGSRSLTKAGKAAPRTRDNGVTYADPKLLNGFIIFTQKVLTLSEMRHRTTTTRFSGVYLRIQARRELQSFRPNI